MGKIKEDDIIGTRIGVLDVLYECDFKANDGHKMYHVKCSECGWESDSRKSDIKRSTRCTHISMSGNVINFKNTWKNERLETIFRGMKDRCYSEKDKAYRWYGGKGIKICEEWLNDPMRFEDWAINNGYNDNLTIDRIEEDKNYCPENCRWILRKDNSKYKSTTSLINVDGEIHTGKDWARKLGLSENIINLYVRKYGLNNTIEFIKRYMDNPNLKPKNKNKSIYSLYMN